LRQRDIKASLPNCDATLSPEKPFLALPSQCCPFFWKNLLQPTIHPQINTERREGQGKAGNKSANVS